VLLLPINGKNVVLLKLNLHLLFAAVVLAYCSRIWSASIGSLAGL
jgi:hypothetical protein